MSRVRVSVPWSQDAVWGNTDLSSQDDDLVDLALGLVGEEFLDDGAANVACTNDGKVLESRHCF